MYSENAMASSAVGRTDAGGRTEGLSGLPGPGERITPSQNGSTSSLNSALVVSLPRWTCSALE